MLTKELLQLPDAPSLLLAQRCKLRRELPEQHHLRSVMSVDCAWFISRLYHTFIARTNPKTLRGLARALSESALQLGNAVSLGSHASESFPTPAHWRGRHRADSVTKSDLARTSTLRYLEYSASRQSSLPINRDCQQTATNYLLYQSRAYTKHDIFFHVSQAPQTIYESPTARAVHGTPCVVWGRPEYIKVGALVGLATAVVQTQR